MAVQDLKGKTFGRLTVIRFAGRNKHGMSLWHCRCECGTRKIVNSNGLNTGKTKSCGCLKQEVLANGREELHQRLVTHGQTGRSEHRIWLNLIYRCETPSCPQYVRYGGRGIRICKKWRRSFMAFLNDMGARPTPGHTVERIDNDGDYAPKNCRWATKKEQANNRRNARRLEFRGKVLTMAIWSELLGLDKATIHGRLRRGWPVEKALGTPPDPRYSRTVKA